MVFEQKSYVCYMNQDRLKLNLITHQTTYDRINGKDSGKDDDTDE